MTTERKRGVRKWLWPVGGALAAALVTAQIAIPAAELKEPGTIRVTGRQTQSARVDVGRRGLSPGDEEISASLLYNKGVRKTPIGHGQLVCTVTSQRFRQCSGSFVLPAGKLVVSGILLYRGLYDLVVVGGTGLYENVRGTLTVTMLDPRPRLDLLVFRLEV
jgi:hypothetical protein